MKWLVIWYDGDRQRAVLVDDRIHALPYGAASNDVRRAILGGEIVPDFTVNAVVEITGELGLVVLDDEEVPQVPHVVLGA